MIPAESPPPDCVIVAAGASSRMGEWKLLLPFGAGTVIEAAVGGARAAGLRVVLVVGFRGDELVELFSRDRLVLPVRNDGWERGMLGSTLRGAAAAESSRVFLMNGDMPLVSPRTYLLLREEAERRRSAGLPEAPLFAAFGGRRGHPVLLSRRAALGAAAFIPPAGREARMRDYLDGLNPAAVECGDEGVLFDVDTPEDYARLRAAPA